MGVETSKGFPTKPKTTEEILTAWRRLPTGKQLEGQYAIGNREYTLSCNEEGVLVAKHNGSTHRYTEFVAIARMGKLHEAEPKPVPAPTQTIKPAQPCATLPTVPVERAVAVEHVPVICKPQRQEHTKNFTAPSWLEGEKLETFKRHLSDGASLKVASRAIGANPNSVAGYVHYRGGLAKFMELLNLAPRSVQTRSRAGRPRKREGTELIPTRSPNSRTHDEKVADARNNAARMHGRAVSQTEKYIAEISKHYEKVKDYSQFEEGMSIVISRLEGSRQIIPFVNISHARTGIKNENGHIDPSAPLVETIMLRFEPGDKDLIEHFRRAALDSSSRLTAVLKRITKRLIITVRRDADAPLLDIMI